MISAIAHCSRVIEKVFIIMGTCMSSSTIESYYKYSYNGEVIWETHWERNSIESQSLKAFNYICNRHHETEPTGEYLWYAFQFEEIFKNIKIKYYLFHGIIIILFEII